MVVLGWLLALTASISALAAVQKELQLDNQPLYYAATWTVTIIALLVMWLLPSELSLLGASGCAASDFFTSLQIAIGTIIGAAGLLSIRMLIASNRSRANELLRLATTLESKASTPLSVEQTEFVTIASHQLRAPLTAIRGHASMLLDGTHGRLPAAAIEPLTQMESAAKHMALSVEDYLSAARIESGMLTYALTDWTVAPDIEAIADELRPQALRKGLVLLFRTNLQTKGISHSDRVKALEVVRNVIDNAIKYTNKGTVTVFVTDDPAQHSITIKVIDTGKGIDEAEQVTLFHKFNRGVQGNYAADGGTGLGLFIASELLRGMNGTLDVLSGGTGKGSTFTITLPLVD
jgi:signal transduction histidine kinase